MISDHRPDPAYGLDPFLDHRIIMSGLRFSQCPSSNVGSAAMIDNAVLQCSTSDWRQQQRDTKFVCWRPWQRATISLAVA